MLMALIHIAGTVAALFAFGILLVWINGWEVERNKSRLLQELAAKLGTTVVQLEADANTSRLVQASFERYSNELLKNRLSDLCGVVRMIWGWLGSALQYGVLAYVLWSAVAENSNNAVFAWSAIGIAVIFWLTSLVFSFACYVLTGRFPGEARAARKSLAQFSEQATAATSQ
jgi:hypothetical protein